MPHYEHTAFRTVEFCETDMAGLVHFSNFFRYMETAEREFFDLCGLPLIRTGGDTLVGWPRVRAEAKFFAPLRFGDRVAIHLVVASVGDRSIDFQFRLYREGPTRVEVAKGRFTTLYTRLDPDTGELRSSPLPSEVTGIIVPAPAVALSKQIPSEPS